MCGCNEYMNSGVLVDEMKSKCVMYYLHIPLSFFFFSLKSKSDLPKQDKMVWTFLLKLSMLAKKGFPFLSAISNGHLN